MQKKKKEKKRKETKGEAQREMGLAGVFNRQSMKRVRGIKGPMERDRSRFAVLAEPIGSGSRNPGDPRPYLQCKVGDRASQLPTNEHPAHAIRPLPSKGPPPLCRSTTHGYVRLFRYADDPAERPTGNTEYTWGSSALSLAGRKMGNFYPLCALCLTKECLTLKLVCVILLRIFQIYIKYSIRFFFSLFLFFFGVRIKSLGQVIKKFDTKFHRLNRFCCKYYRNVLSQCYFIIRIFDCYRIFCTTHLFDSFF